MAWLMSFTHLITRPNTTQISFYSLGGEGGKWKKGEKTSKKEDFMILMPSKVMWTIKNALPLDTLSDSSVQIYKVVNTALLTREVSLKETFILISCAYVLLHFDTGFCHLETGSSWFPCI